MRLLVDGEERALPDFVIPRMGSNTTYFALAVIRHFESLGVFVLNRSDSVEMVKDKMYSMQLLAKKNIMIPKTKLMKFPFCENHTDI